MCVRRTNINFTIFVIRDDVAQCNVYLNYIPEPQSFTRADPIIIFHYVPFIRRLSIFFMCLPLSLYNVLRKTY